MFAVLCLLALVRCFGGWQVPLDAQGNPIDPEIGPTVTPATGTPTPTPTSNPGSPGVTTPASPLPAETPAPEPAQSPMPATPTADGNTCQPIADFFNAQMWTPIMSTTCVECHQDASNPFHLTAGDPTSSLTATEAEAKKTGTNNTSLLLLKPTGQVTHGGGMVFSTTSSTYMAFQSFVTAVNANASCVTPP